jgi:hypothetical protein
VHFTFPTAQLKQITYKSHTRTGFQNSKIPHFHATNFPQNILFYSHPLSLSPSHSPPQCYSKSKGSQGNLELKSLVLMPHGGSNIHNSRYGVILLKQG